MKPNKTWLRWLWLLAGLVVMVWAYQTYELGDWLTLERLKDSRDQLLGLFDQRPVLTLVVYFSVYVLATAASFPGAVILTLAGGAIFAAGILGGALPVA
jgi:uncharacterized membrane protein YdjX (TVP38/TMEM64 family)